MNNLEDNDSMADFLRLQNLKKLSSQRLRGRADNQFADMQNPDLSGTASPPPPFIEENIPGNFDVRANQKIDPLQNQGIYSKLSMLQGGNPPDQGMPPPATEALPPAQPDRIKDYVNAMSGKSGYPKELNTPPDPERAKAGEAYIAALSGKVPEGFASFLNPPQAPAPEASPPPVDQPSPINQVAPTQNPPVETPQTQQEGESTPKPQVGSVTQVMGNPTLKAEIDKYFGPIDPAMGESAISYEKAMDDYAKGLDYHTQNLTDQDKQIRERIESRNLTTKDKILMGLALVAPMLIAGAFGGKQAFVGALGGTAKGVGDVIAGRDKEGKEDLEKLSTLSKEKSLTAKEKASIIPLTSEFRAKLAKGIPNKDLREVFERDGELIDGRLVINSGNPLLPIKAEALRDIDDYKKMKIEVDKQAKGVATLSKATKLMDNLRDLAHATLESRKDKNFVQGVASAVGNKLNLYDYTTGAMKAFYPFTRDTMKDENGNQIKISELMATYRAQLADSWRDAHGNNSNAFKATEAHFDKQLPDPNTWSSFIYGQSDINQFLKQLDAVDQNFQEAVDYWDLLGFDVNGIREGLKNTRGAQKAQKQKSIRDKGEELAKDAISKNQGR